MSVKIGETEVSEIVCWFENESESAKNSSAEEVATQILRKHSCGWSRDFIVKFLKTDKFCFRE